MIRFINLHIYTHAHTYTHTNACIHTYTHESKQLQYVKLSWVWDFLCMFPTVGHSCDNNRYTSGKQEGPSEICLGRETGPKQRLEFWCVAILLFGASDDGLNILCIFELVSTKNNPSFREPIFLF